MFFIYGTDAPLYHYPIVTSVMIAVNVFIHFLVGITGYDVTPWILAFGDGLHPIQWVTHNFLHIGWLHLIGNMIFLLPFGLIVEGKIGALRMLLLYLAIGTFQGFTQQTIMLSHDPIGEAEALVELFNDPDNPMDDQTRRELTRQWRQDLMKEGFGSLGASAVIFGLLAICAIWAPVNEFDVYFRWSLLISAPDGGERSWSVLTVCGIFVFKEFFMFLMMGMPISSEALHLNGFVVGAVLGLAMLYYGMVDCEGFDLISVWSGTRFISSRTIETQRRERQQELEAARPKGPPPAVVPKMAHQLEQPRVVRQSPTAVLPVPSSVPSSPLRLRPEAEGLPAAAAAASLLTDDLPAFTDGLAPVDPLEISRRNVEAMVMRGDFLAALRLLAETRQQHQSFFVSPMAIGRLAEGLLQEQKVKSAMAVLKIGCEAYPAYAARWRLRMASIELTVHRDPIKAIKQLRMIDRDALDSKLREQYLKVAQTAKRMAGG